MRNVNELILDVLSKDKELLRIYLEDSKKDYHAALDALRMAREMLICHTSEANIIGEVRDTIKQIDAVLGE